MTGTLVTSSAARARPRKARTSGRGVGEGQPHETDALDLDHQHHALRRIVPHGKVLARVLREMRSMILKSEERIANTSPLRQRLRSPVSSRTRAWTRA